MRSISRRTIIFFIIAIIVFSITPITVYANSINVPTITPVLFRAVDEPLIEVSVLFYDNEDEEITSLEDYSVVDNTYFYASSEIAEDRLFFSANAYPNEMPFSTEPVKYRVLLDSEIDISDSISYDVTTGIMNVPANFDGHKITVEWYVPVSEVKELPLNAVINLNAGDEYSSYTETLNVLSDDYEIRLPAPDATGISVSQNGVDLPDSSYGFEENNGITEIVVNISPLGGDIQVNVAGAFMTTFSTNKTSITSSRNENQIYYGYYTKYYWADGNQAFCLNPTLRGASNGVYGISRYLNKYGTYEEQTLSKIAYYGFGGIGYGSFRNTFFGADWADDQIYAYCHLAASYVYMGGSSSALMGVSASGRQTAVNLVNAFSAMPTPPVGFDAFIYNEGDDQQPIMGWDYEPPSGIEIVKVSNKEEMTTGNPNYSLSGAVFDVYDAWGNLAATITTDATGRGKCDGLLPGSYKIIERTPSPGYAKNPNEFWVNTTAGATATVTIPEPPQNDPVGILLRKKDSATSSGAAQGGAGLAGAEFTVKYYKGHYTTAAQVAGASPDRTWVIKTNANGIGLLKSEFIVSGPALYYDSTGTIPTLPLGTVTIQETKAPTGYVLNNELFIRNITSTTNGIESVSTYNEPIINENVIRGGVRIQKWDNELNAKEPQGSATLQGAVFEIVSKNAQSVIVDGAAYNNGAVVKNITTDANGIAATANNTLPYGSYEIREKTPPTGYLNTGTLSRTFNITTNGVIVDLNANATAIKNNPIRGGVRIEKWDNELNRKEAQGEGTLQGAVFEIYNRSNGRVKVNGVVYAKDQVVATLTTVADGSVSTSNNFLPYGDYEVVEKTAPTGYLNTGVVRKTFQIRSNGVIVNLNVSATAIKNNVIRGGVRIEKWDNELDRKEEQGETTFKGAVFEIYNRSTGKVLVNGTLYSKDQVVATVTTGTDGSVSTANNLLPYGDYEIVEKTPPTGYQHNGVIRSSFQIRSNGVIVNLNSSSTSIKNNVIRGGVRVEKWDNETNEHIPQGGATFEGAEFEIVSRNPHKVLVDGTLYGNGEVVYTALTDENGVFITSDTLLPYGTYEVRETKAPNGYLHTGVLSRTFSIRQQGVIVNLNTSDTAIKNNPIRGDLKGVKISDGDAIRLSNVPFKITNLTTNESHIIVTDKNGQFDTSSSWNPHSRNTNRGETDKDGIWFGKPETLNDNMGALLYGDYRFEELPCPSNEGRELLTFEVTVYKHNTVVDLGTLTNDYIPTPEIFTTAAEKDTLMNEAFASEKTVIVDTVYYGGLKVGREYTLKGVLMDKQTGEPLLIDSSAVENMTTFKASSPEGSVPVKFAFNSTGLNDKNIVVYETLEYDGNVVAEHRDMNDVAQTITLRSPEIRTSANSPENDKWIDISDRAVIIDKVSFSGLIPNETYVVSGILMDKETGEKLLIDGQEITDKKEFTPELPDGTVDVNFKLDTSAIMGKEIVIFETLTYKGKEIASHRIIDDKEQTVTVKEPKISTNAAGENGEKELPVSTDTEITDTITFEGLKFGQKYIVQGKLMDKATGEPIKFERKEVTATVYITPNSTIGTAKIRFNFNSTELAGKEIVVFEKLFLKENEIAAHEDLNDPKQTIKFKDVEITTEATDESGFKELPVSANTVIKDKITFKGLKPNEKYVVQGRLLDKITGKPITVKGQEITVTNVFYPQTENGEIEVLFTFDSSELSCKEIVAYEKLLLNETVLASHEDLSDKKQTVRFKMSEIMTNAEGEDGLKELPIAQNSKIIDTVTFKNLKAGEKYTLRGTLMDKLTQKPVKVKGATVTAAVDIIPVSEEGTATVEFEFNSTELANKEVVVYEELYLNDVLLANHTEINDTRQTVKFIRPEIVTTAMGKNNEIQIKAEKGAVIRDVIAYKGLQAGQEYRLEGILMDKQTGEPLLIGDKEITSKKKFTPENSDGNVEVSFTFNAKTLSGKVVVVFEKLYISETEIAAHEDLNDEMQTVQFLDKPGDTTPRIPKLGYDDTPNVWLILSIAASALCTALCLYRRFKGREK